MTREEFARRWLGRPAILARDLTSLPQPRRLTDASGRTFKEYARQPSRAVRVARLLGQWATGFIAASLLFGCMVVVIIKLAPYITDYLATYLPR